MVKTLIVGVVAAVAFIIYALVDCLSADRSRFRALNKGVWALVIVVLPVIGAVLWFVLGRRSYSALTRRSRVLAPDDDPDFLGRRQRPLSVEDREATDERIRRLEQELAEHDGDDTNKNGNG